MTDWKNISVEEGKKKYADMAMTMHSLMASGDLDPIVDEEVEKLVKAEKDGDLAEAHQLKAKLLKQGVVLEETREGITWRWA